jgi:bifunctional non-homologous end joining protein LigD
MIVSVDGKCIERRKMGQKKQATLRVAGRDVNLTNLDKVMYPEIGFTKGQVIDYYTRVARYILPHLKDRPITMKRFPNGTMGSIFMKRMPHLSRRIGSRPIPSRGPVKNP